MSIGISNLDEAKSIKKVLISDLFIKNILKACSYSNFQNRLATIYLFQKELV